MTARSLPLRLVLQYVLTLVALWLIARFLPHYLVVGGGRFALPVIAALVLLLNLFARPILRVVTLPLKLLMTLAAVALVNAAFLWLLERIVERFDPTVAVLAVEGGLGGWIVVAFMLGFANWMIHHIARL